MDIVPIENMAEIRPVWERLNRLHAEKSTHFRDHFNRFTFDARMAELSDKDAVGIFGAREDQALVGYCIASVHNETGEIDSIFVDAEYRKSGLGDRLMAAAESWLSTRPVSRIRVSVAQGNESVLGFYGSRGYFPRFTMLEKDTAK